jgi:hypothetical protein
MTGAILRGQLRKKIFMVKEITQSCASRRIQRYVEGVT